MHLSKIARFLAASLLVIASSVYLFFVVPIWMIGQGMAGAPIFEFHPMVLSVEAVGLLLIALWFAFYRWLKKPVS